MDANEVERIGRKVYGRGWRAKMSAALGVNRVTLYRWMSAGFVTDRTALALKQIEDLHDETVEADQWKYWQSGGPKQGY